ARLKCGGREPAPRAAGASAVHGAVGAGAGLHQPHARPHGRRPPAGKRRHGGGVGHARRGRWPGRQRHGPGRGRSARQHDRPLQAAPEDRRGRVRRRVHGRAGTSGAPQSGAEGHQARDGHRTG
ncbi:MAG: Serine/threonine protein kinase, partial [uncultured Phycisphaerae bacterium]